MRLFAAFAIAKFLRFLTRLRGGGSAFPGFVLLRLVPDALERAVGSLPRGVIFVTGSNGKSTTTAMLTEILRAHGLRVFSNPAGGNLPQGLASALVGGASLLGRVAADIAVLEVDEAYGASISDLVAPDWVVITNIQVDQLNRFGEPEAVYRLLLTLGHRATAGVVINGSDPNTTALGAELHATGTRVEQMQVSSAAQATAAHGLVPAPLFFDPTPNLAVAPGVVVSAVRGPQVSLDVAGAVWKVTLPQPGLHYAVDAGLAMEMASVVLQDFQPERAVAALELGAGVYGRGEVIRYRGVDISLTMMKNLPSLQVNLDAFPAPLENVFIAVDEGTPDPSWIFDVDTRSLASVSVLSGSKAWQWALLLEHRGIPYGEVIEDSRAGLDAFIKNSPPQGGPLHAIVNYEQMMRIRRIAGYKELEGAR